MDYRFTVAEVLADQARTSARATWRAVQALTERASTARWAASDPELYGLGSSEDLHQSAKDDEETADILTRQAQALDRTVAAFTGEDDAG